MNDLAVVVPEAGTAMTVDGLEDQVKAIQQVMQKVMKEDTHYGKIPGCGDKPALLQPGAHKLGLLFNLSPEYVMEINDLSGEHREYEVICKLRHRATGNFIGEGVGICSTRESKYRYRSEDTGVLVPQEYWQDRDRDLIGGPSFSVKKVYVGDQAEWHIVQKVEHDNPADYYNTAKKIAKKRAYNDAILTATAASDIFVPDDNTDPEYMSDDEGAEKQTVNQPQSRSNNQSNGNPATDKQRKMIFAKLKNAGISMDIFEQEFGKLDDLPFSSVNKALEWIGTFEKDDSNPY